MRIDHAALRAYDPVRLALWYQRWLGLQEELVLRSPRRPSIHFLIDGAGNRVEIIPASLADASVGRVVAPHLAFASEDLDGDVERLRAASATVLEDRRTSAGWRIAFAEDPEGNLLEFVERMRTNPSEGRVT